MKNAGSAGTGAGTPPAPQRWSAISDARVEEWAPVPGDADGLVAGLGLVIGLLVGLAVGSAIGHVAIVAGAGAIGGVAAGAIAEARERRSADSVRPRTEPDRRSTGGFAHRGRRR